MADDFAWWDAKSLPLMRKTFIEAALHTAARTRVRVVSSAYAEDFH